jgi:acylphosphatase
MIKHLKIKIYGRVQGVSFRYYTAEKAKQLGVKGWVRNEDDGTVCIEAEGEKAVLEQFLSWCRKGSRWAKVDRLEQEWSDNLNNFDDFTIKYY